MINLYKLLDSKATGRERNKSKLSDRMFKFLKTLHLLFLANSSSTLLSDNRCRRSVINITLNFLILTFLGLNWSRGWSRGSTNFIREQDGTRGRANLVRLLLLHSLRSRYASLPGIVRARKARQDASQQEGRGNRLSNKTMSASQVRGKNVKRKTHPSNLSYGLEIKVRPLSASDEHRIQDQPHAVENSGFDKELDGAVVQGRPVLRPVLLPGRGDETVRDEHGAPQGGGHREGYVDHEPGRVRYGAGGVEPCLGFYDFEYWAEKGLG